MSKDTSPKRTNRELLSVFWRTVKDIFRASKKTSFILFVIVTALALLPFLTTYLSTRVIDELILLTSGGDAAEFTQSLVVLVSAYLLADLGQGVFWAIRSYFERINYYKLNEHFNFQFLNKSSTLDLYHFENAAQNDLIQRARDSYAWRPPNIANRILWTSRHLIEVIASLGIIAAFSPLFLMVLAISVVPSITISIKQTNIEWSVWAGDVENRRKFWDISSYLSGERSLMELRIFGTSNYLLNQLKKMYHSFNSRQMKVTSRRAFYESLSTLFAVVGTFVFWIFLISQVLEGNITIGLLGFYSSSGNRFQSAIQNLFSQFSKYYEDTKYMADYYDFLALENTIISGKKKLKNKKKEPPEIVFKHVDFTYPDGDKPALQNFDLTIKPGERIALVGENGAGKTTVIKLLSRFYDVTSGQILIDGQDLRDLNVNEWYGNVGVLFQNFIQYSFLPAKENIALGDIKKMRNTAEITRAAKQSGAHEVISALKKGYEQLLSKHYPEGTDLSGGEWQRVALARGFFRDAPILILDEPTSAIDAKGEYEIFQRLYEFAENKTIIIISHRFSTVRQADKIYVMRDGRIVEQGSHEELMAIEGTYADAFEKQAAGYK